MTKTNLLITTGTISGLNAAGSRFTSDGITRGIRVPLNSIRFLQVESEKNKLENLLKNNLLKKLEQIQTDVQEMTSDDIRQRLEVYGAEMESVTQRIAENNNTFKGRSSPSSPR